MPEDIQPHSDNQLSEQQSEPNNTKHETTFQQSEPTNTEPDTLFQPDQNTVIVSPKNKSPLVPILFVLLLVLIVACGAFYITRNHNKQVTVANKDISNLTYAFSDAADIYPAFPLQKADTVYTTLIDNQLFESLVKYQDQTKVVPALATGWTNPDESTWIFNLRHGVTFHDGIIFTASDVKYSLDYAISHQNDYNGSTTFYLASTIKSVNVVNPYQVKITTKQPDAVFLNRLAGGLFIFNQKAKLGDPNAGTGPYIVKTGPKSTTTLDLQAYNPYWGGHIFTRSVHIVEDPTFDQMAKNAAAGKYDLSGDFDSKQIARIKAKSTAYQPITVPDLGTHFLTLNTNNVNSPLHTLQARQALAYALNIPQILKTGSITGSQASQLIPSELAGYDPSIKNTQYSPQKAKILLAQVPKANTQLNLYYPKGDEDQMTEIAKELNAVGFNIKLTSVGDLGALINRITAGQGDIFFLSYNSNTLDGLDIVSTVVAGTKNYSNSELDSLITQANATIDPSTRITILQKIEQLVSKDVPTVPLYSETRTFAQLKPYVVNVDLPALATGTYFWQVRQK